MDSANNANVDLLHVDRIAQYEALVKTAKEYNFENNLALLRLYSSFPEHVNIELVSSILLRALTVLPNTDYLLCCALIPERMYSKLAAIVEMAELLERCSFPAFWAASTKHAAILPSDFTAAVRDGFIAGVIEISFQKIPLHLLASQLHLQGKPLEEYATRRGWTIDAAAASVDLPLSESNQALSSRYTKEPITAKPLAPFIKKYNQATDL